MSLKAKLDVYPLENYILTAGEATTEKTPGAGNKKTNNNEVPRIGIKSPLEKLMSLRARCHEEQCVQSVEGVLITHLHRHPHIILLKQTATKVSRDPTGTRVLPPTQAHADVSYRLPGGRCRRGEQEEMCLLRKLGRHLLNDPKAPLVHPESMAGPSDTVVEVGPTFTSEAHNYFRVGEVLAKWYRPHFSPLMYPYVPSHISTSSVKEVRTVFLVHLGPMVYFSMAQQDVELVAVPLFDLYENSAKYGPIVASLPALLSRVLVNYCSTEF